MAFATFVVFAVCLTVGLCSCLRSVSGPSHGVALLSRRQSSGLLRRQADERGDPVCWAVTVAASTWGCSLVACIFTLALQFDVATSRRRIMSTCQSESFHRPLTADITFCNVCCLQWSHTCSHRDFLWSQKPFLMWRSSLDWHCGVLMLRHGKMLPPRVCKSFWVTACAAVSKIHQGLTSRHDSVIRLASQCHAGISANSTAKQVNWIRTKIIKTSI